MLHVNVFSIRRLLSLALLGLAGLTSGVQAQELPRVKVGERIRLTYSENNSTTSSIRISGTLIERRADTLVVALSPASISTVVPIASIWQLDAYRPKRERILWYSAIGAGAGAVFLGALVALAPAPCFGSCPPTTWSEVMDAAATGAVLGAIPGALVGSFLVLTRPWEQVRLPYVASMTSEPDGRIALAASIRF